MKNSRRNFLMQAGSVALAASTTALAAPDANTVAKGKARSRTLIIDSLGEIGNPNLPEADQEGPGKGIDRRALADAKASGLCAFNQTLGYVAGKFEPFEHSVREIAQWDALIRANSHSLLKVLGVRDIRRARDEGKLGVIYGFQNAAMMGNDAKRVAIFANLGVRVIQLTYNVRNQLGDGSMVAENKGLTEFGRTVVHELNQNRVIVDLSHSGEKICLDAATASQQPIVISHTGCRALTDLPRNKSDQELRLVADKGGYVGIYFMPFLAIDSQPMAADLIAHIEHAVNVCGEDHVGIGTDGTVPAIDDMPEYIKRLKKEHVERVAGGIAATGERDDIVTFLPDLAGPQKFHKLADLLAKRGHKSARIEKILGLNFLRAAERIW